MKKRLLALLLCLLLLPLGGCTDPLSQSLMVISMGVDLTDGGYVITIKAPNYGATGGGEENQTEENYLTLSVRGQTWAHAMSLLHAATPRVMRFGQLREVVLSLDTARSGHLHEILTQVDILQNVRTHARVIICRESAQDFLKSQKSAIGKRLSTYLDVTLDTLRSKGYIPTATLSSLLRDLGAAWRDPLIAYAAFPKEHKPAEGTAFGEYAGALAVGSGGRFALLTGYEVQLYHLITGEITSMALGVDGQYFDVLPRGKSTQTLTKENGQDVLHLHLPVTVEYSAFRDAPTQDIAAHLEGEIEKLIEKLQRAACDALGYGGLAARQHKTLFDFSQSGWESRYQSAAVSVTVDVLLRQQGRT